MKIKIPNYKEFFKFLSEINYDFIIDVNNLLFIKDSFNKLDLLYRSNSIKFLYICSESNINKLDINYIKKYHNIYIAPSYVDDDLYIINAYLYKINSNIEYSNIEYSNIYIITNDLYRDHINKYKLENTLRLIKIN
jgi:hypothetical protein